MRLELTPRNILISLNAGLIVYLFEIILILSFAALVFAGDLSRQLPFALGSILVGGAVLVAIVGLLGSYEASIPVAQDPPSVILGLAAASIAAAEQGARSEEVLATIVVLVAGTSLVFGLVCLVLGSFRLGALVRFLPYPVLGGFLAGTGWLLAVGGVRVTTTAPMSLELFEAEVLPRWLPAILLGVLTLFAVRRWRSPLVLPALFGAALILFHVLSAAAGVSRETLNAEGWLLGPFPEGMAFRLPVGRDILSEVRWAALGDAIPLAAPAVLFGVIGLLLNASSIELIAGKDMRLSRELVATGGGNLVGGLVGGIPGYSAISLTVLNQSLGGGRRLTALVVAVLLVLTVAVGMSVLSLIPRMLLGGLLVYIGLALLVQWVIEARSSFTRVDYAIVLSVLAVIVAYDLLWGVALGLVLTVVLFVLSNSRVSLIRYEATGSSYRSRVDRSPRQADILRTRGDELLVFKLQNYLFFGTAHQLADRVRQRIAARGDGAVRVVLLDFERVTGLDSTALLSFRKLRQALRADGIALVLTGLGPPTRRQLLAGGIGADEEGGRVFADMDRGVEWAEDLILSSGQPEEHLHAQALEAQFAAILPDEPRIADLIDLMERREVAPGERIVQQGDPADALYVLESGQLTTYLERPDREPIRLVTMLPGRLVGEIGFFLGTTRSATVMADRPSVIHVLSRDAWAATSASDPGLALLLHRLVIHQLGTRVIDLTRTVEATVE
jgi:sulfate permease, SulP family